jgi:serine/threonine-protein kinase
VKKHQAKGHDGGEAHDDLDGTRSSVDVDATLYSPEIGRRVSGIIPVGTAAGRAIASWRPSVALSAIERYGRFEVLGRIGRGGMAEILLARERSVAGSTRHLVIKRILPEVADDDEMLRMFLDEARVVMGLSHPNLCQIYDVGEHAGTWYIAMEWVNGVTLHQLIRRGVSEGEIDCAIVARVIAQCAEALHHAHTARDAEGRKLNLVHRDVSPHNLMIAYDGRVKLLDFGIAKSTASTHRTEAGVVKGKVCYMAPEQWLSEPLDGRTDVFALGACLYEALTGDVVFRRETQMEVMKAILGGEVPKLSDIAPDVPEALSAIVQRALATRPDDRFQTALEMSEALERFLVSLPEPFSASRVAEYTRHMFRSELSQGPILERPVRGAEIDPHLALPPVPKGRLGLPEIGPPPLPLRPKRVSQTFAVTSERRALTPPLGLEASYHAAEQELAPPASDLEPTVIDSSSPFDDAPTNERPMLAPLAPRVSSALTASDRLRGHLHETTDEMAADEPGARPLAGTLAMPVVQSIRRIALAVTPAAAAMLLLLYWALPADEAKHSQIPRTTAAPASAPAAASSVEAEPVVEVESERPIAEKPAPRAPVRARAVSREPVEQPEMVGSGLLSINTRPWSTVYLGTRLLGTTPIARVEVPSSSLTLKLVDRDGRVHLRRVARSTDEVREVFFDFDAPANSESP